MESSGGGPIRGALARLRAAPMWVWITILLTFGLLIFAYLQWRKSSANSTTAATGTSADTSSAGLGTVPASGSGQPLWNTADTSGFVAGNVTDLANLLAYLRSTQTPNAPTTATPTTPTTTPTTTPASSGAQYFTITQNYSSSNWATTTLAGIAGKFGTTVGRLMQLNPQITNPNLVYKGEQIRVK